MTSVGVWAILLFVLSACATKHQPKYFAPFFPTRAASHFLPEHLAEIKELEAKPVLDSIEKKRLWELYQLERRTLKPGTAVYVELMDAIDQLRLETQESTSGFSEVTRTDTNNRTPPSVSPFNWTHAILKKRYLDAYQFWNKDQNDQAYKRVNEIYADEKLKSEAPKNEWFRIVNLRFHIAAALGDLDAASSSYEELRLIADCAPETTTAAYSLLLRFFSKGDADRAIQIFDKQCDSDESFSNRVRKRYWWARLHEGSEEAKKIYEELSHASFPSYYNYLASQRLGQVLTIPLLMVNPPAYLQEEFRVPKEAHWLLLNVEERLQKSVRREASQLLFRVGDIFRNENVSPTSFAQLYLAHLFQAAGYHLEAIKIYSNAVSNFSEKNINPKDFPLDFLPEMFPRPFQPFVEWYAHVWAVDPDLIYSLMRQESAFNPGANSPTDARGLMQLMPFVAKALAERWSYLGEHSDRGLFNIEENLKLASFHLQQLQSVAPHIVLMIASYNAGYARVEGWWRRNGMYPMDVFVELIPVAETRNYVKLVLRNLIYYKALLNNGVFDGSKISFELPPSPPPKTH